MLALLSLICLMIDEADQLALSPLIVGLDRVPFLELWASLTFSIGILLHFFLNVCLLKLRFKTLEASLSVSSIN